MTYGRIGKLIRLNMSGPSSTTLADLDRRLRALAKQITETQRQIELVDAPPIFAPHQILVTDSCGQIVDSGINPAIIVCITCYRK